MTKTHQRNLTPLQACLRGSDAHHCSVLSRQCTVWQDAWWLSAAPQVARKDEEHLQEEDDRCGGLPACSTFSLFLMMHNRAILELIQQPAHRTQRCYIRKFELSFASTVGHRLRASHHTGVRCAGINVFSSFEGTDHSERLENTFNEVQTVRRGR